MYELPDHSDRTVLITGATSGLGLEAARRFAAVGATVIIAARNLTKAEGVRAQLHQQLPDGKFQIRHLDLASLGSVKDFVSGLEADHQSVDTLINNAGVMAPPHREETADGIELQFGTNFVGPYALTARLLPLLLESDRPRVATQASFAGHFLPLRHNDPDAQGRYLPWPAYANSKLSDLLLGLRLAEVSAEKGWKLRSTIAHPGYTKTPLQLTGPMMGRTRAGLRSRVAKRAPGAQQVWQGVEPILVAAGSNAALAGDYFGPSGFLALSGPARVIPLPPAAKAEGLTRLIEDLGERYSGLRLEG